MEHHGALLNLDYNIKQNDNSIVIAKHIKQDITEVLEISSSSTYSDFLGFYENVPNPANFEDEALIKTQKLIGMHCHVPVVLSTTIDAHNQNHNLCVKGFEVNNLIKEMEVSPTEEVFEINSNSTTASLREQRLARNGELRLNAIKNQIKQPTAIGRCEYISESSSEFPASSPSNPQLEKKFKKNERPVLLKNTLPADAFERGLALIVARNPQMSMSEKVDSWQCANDELSEVEDVVNFDATFEKREESKKNALSIPKYGSKNKLLSNDKQEFCGSFTDFQRRLFDINQRQQKQKSKNRRTEDDEKPSTSSKCVLRNFDTPLKKRTCKYKRAGDNNIAFIPNKKSSSSDTPQNNFTNPKRKFFKHEAVAHITNLSGSNIRKAERALRASSSEASSQIDKNENTNAVTRNLRSHVQSKLKVKPTQIKESAVISSNPDNKIQVNTSAIKEDEHDSFFKWRRFSREIDKLELNKLSSNRLQEKNECKQDSKRGLIQIRYDFIEPNRSDSEANLVSKSYNVVVKTLKKDEEPSSVPAPVQKDFAPEAKQTICQDNLSNRTEETVIQQTQGLSQSAEIVILNSVDKIEANNNTEIFNSSLNGEINTNSGAEFHQQHEFCNYLGLTGMSTANAMQSAAEELSKCKLARRSLRVRHLEQRKAKIKVPKADSTIEKSNSNQIVTSLRKSHNSPIKKSRSMENTSSICAASGDLELESNVNCKTMTLSASEQWMQMKKEKEAKIQILCQITASSKEEEEEACKKCVEQITAPIRRSLQNEYQQCITASDAVTSKQLIKADSPVFNRDGAKRIEGGNELSKFIDMSLRTVTRTSGGSLMGIVDAQAEIQSLHKKVQKCLEEARQNTPNIFIVQSLNSLKEAVKSTTNGEAEPTSKIKDGIQISEQNTTDTKLSARTSYGISSTKSHKATQVNPIGSTRVTNQKTRAKVKRSISKLSTPRKLYTRSMLNLNQQRELRNRKVILKLLKTYSGLKIKVSKPKKKAIAPARCPGRTTVTRSKSALKVEHKNAPAIKADVIDTVNSSSSNISGPMFFNLSDSSITNGLGGSISVVQLNPNKNENIQSSSRIEEENSGETDTQVTIECRTASGQSKVEIVGEIILNAQNTSTSTSRTIAKQETPATTNVLKSLENKNENLNRSEETSYPSSKKKISQSKSSISGNIKRDISDAAVQTDMPSTEISPELAVDQMPAASENHYASPGQRPNDLEGSSSDVVTSTTSGIGDNNRTQINLVAKDLYRNFSFAVESVISSDTIQLERSSATNFVELNPLANVSMTSTFTNINRLGVHALSEPTKAVTNPLKSINGRVLHIYYEFDVLIAVQEKLVSFWKYMRILNALTVSPHERQTDEAHIKPKSLSNCNNQEESPQTPEHQSSAATMDFRSSDLDEMSSMLVCGSEWIYLGQKKRLCTDIEISSPFINRLCISDSRPVYVEMRCRELVNNFRECNLLSCYVNVYYFNEDKQIANCHSIQLDSIQSVPTDVIFTTIHESRYFVLAWPQANVLGKVRSGLCKYALTPELDMLATTRDFKAMRHALRSLECLNDGKLLGFGDNQLTVWDQHGDVLMNYDLSMPLGRNLGNIYYPSLEPGQDSVIVMFQHVRNEASSDLAIVACSISHTSPSRRVLHRYRLPSPPFYNIRSGINNGDHFIITADTDEEIWISCNDPRQLIFVPTQSSQRFYTRGRTQLIELSNETLEVDSFSNYLLKIAAGLNGRKFSEKLNAEKNWWI